MPGKGELPVHEECYEKCLPKCAWCRVELTDSYVLYKGKSYGIVSLHEGCKDAFEVANMTTKSDKEIQSLSKPSAAKLAGKNTDRLFIDQLSKAEVMAELTRRGITMDPAKAAMSRSALVKILRDHWDDRVVQ
eukprot:gene15811-24153_t